MINEIINMVFWHNKVYEYLLAILIFVAGIFLIKISQRLITNKALPVMPDKFSQLSLEIGNSVAITFYLLLFYSCLNSLNLPKKVDRIADLLATVVFVILFINIINNSILSYLFKKHLQQKMSGVGIFSRSFFLVAAKIIVWIIGIGILVENLGFKLTPLMAGLGIGGVAIALASQVLLKDLFSCFAIYFDRPFSVGDYIIVDKFLGTVEYIGIKTTRLRSLGGEELILSNSDLTEARIRNYKRMERRRVLFNFQISYETPIDKLQAIPKAIKDIIVNMDNTTYDRAHLARFEDYGYAFEIVYYVLSREYNTYMDVQQKINFAILEYFNTNQISFSNYPTITKCIVEQKN